MHTQYSESNNNNIAYCLQYYFLAHSLPIVVKYALKVAVSSITYPLPNDLSLSIIYDYYIALFMQMKPHNIKMLCT